MQNIKFKSALYIFLAVTGLLWFFIARLSGLDLMNFVDYMKPLPKVALIEILLFVLFYSWGWKSRLFKNWLVPFPNLNGTWQGYIKTTWVNPETNQSPSDVPVILTIKQSFLKVSCVMRTTEMTSYSFSEAFKLDNEDQIKQLSYSYTSKPLTTVIQRSPQHDGSIVFDTIGDPVTKLKGQYWTARKTTGEIILTFREKKLLEEYPSDLGEHPMRERI